MPQRVRAILLDAVGTAIYPARDVAVTYAEFGRRHGSKLTPEEIGPLLREAFLRQEDADRQLEFKTSEMREERRWMEIVTEIFNVLGHEVFHPLWAHYQQPEAWRVFPDVGPFLKAALARGMEVILASNFDARLRTIVSGLGELRGLNDLVISSELGWRKPSPSFYRKILDDRGLMPEEVVAVGDDVTNDLEGAATAGIRAYLLDRGERFTGTNVVRNLDQIALLLQDRRG